MHEVPEVLCCPFILQSLAYVSICIVVTVAGDPQILGYTFRFVFLSRNKIGPILVDSGGCVCIVVKVAA